MIEKLAPGAALTAEEILADYRVAFRSRVASVIGAREVVSGKAVFGIMGDGKEVAQVALARVMRPGDWRAGYYRDQTLMLALGLLSLRGLFAQLYGDTNIEREPASGGRQMNNQFATRLLDANGDWLPQLTQANSASGFGSVAFQMSSALGLAYASKLYRGVEGLANQSAGFSNHGDEVTFASIGNASAAEGIFFETLNAAGVLQVPLVALVWDDGYGISVPNELQMVRSSVSEALSGFAGDEETRGFEIHAVPGWDYPRLLDVYQQAADAARAKHVPVLVHVTELTQPLGHSTSGSHERYKDRPRLDWELEYDCLARMRTWLLSSGVAERDRLEQLETEDRAHVESERDAAWKDYCAELEPPRRRLRALLDRVAQEAPGVDVTPLRQALDAPPDAKRRAVAGQAARALYLLRDREVKVKDELNAFLAEQRDAGRRTYTSHLFSESAQSPLEVEEVKPEYSDSSPTVDGRHVLVRCFEHHLSSDPRVFVVGEDVGRLGDVNLVYEGLQAKFGDLRIADTGIREATILGQGIGAALRGLRPIVDIQYLDYFKFALEIASDDLATLHFRTAGGQKAPVIIRTKGHRLVGITHAGSPMAEILHSCRGIYLCVPRDMTRAAGMYNTLFRGDNPALVIEVLNGYRLKERVPDNLSSFTVPLGIPEVLRPGKDVTVITYGALCRIALEAAATLAGLGVEMELIDVQTLSPFDRAGRIIESVKKTGALVCLDEDVPGGASAHMLREVLEVQGGYDHLDSAPVTLSGTENRPAYGGDGDYFTKPNHEDIVEAVYEIARERRPGALPRLFPR
ncbi:MAG TPA: thiamine pyrophosphate-dependent enzyme [Candidatus Dormibacteraeota bacterium]